MNKYRIKSILKLLVIDGIHQVTSMGAPLYIYTKDIKPGGTKGSGINGA
jgi:predicted lipoprotein with Yx(FWY)xxD motif